MTQAEKDKIINELQEKLAEAEKIEVDKPKQPKQPERWKPKKYELYWLVSEGNICQSVWYSDSDDKWRYLTGNCFKTEEETEEYKNQIEYTARYKNYIEKYNYPINWSDNNQEKWYAYFGFYSNEIKVCSSYAWKKQGIIYASSKQIILDAIKEIGEDNFKKYVLGVK